MSNIIFNGIDLVSTNYKVFKLIDGEIYGISAINYDTTSGRIKRVLKDEEELNGYKPLILSTNISSISNMYEKIVKTYVETPLYIEEQYNLVRLSEDEIIEANTLFWNSSYFLIDTLLPDELYTSIKTNENGSYIDLINSDIAKLQMDIDNGITPSIILLSKPDMTKELTSEYINSLKIEILGSDIDKIKNIIDFLYNKDFETRIFPSVVIDNA